MSFSVRKREKPKKIQNKKKGSGARTVLWSLAACIHNVQCLLRMSLSVKFFKDRSESHVLLSNFIIFWKVDIIEYFYFYKKSLS